MLYVRHPTPSVPTLHCNVLHCWKKGGALSYCHVIPTCLVAWVLFRTGWYPAAVCVSTGLDLSPTHSVLVLKFHFGWCQLAFRLFWTLAGVHRFFSVDSALWLNSCGSRAKSAPSPVLAAGFSYFSSSSVDPTRLGHCIALRWVLNK